MCLPKVATQWNSGATWDSNRGRRVLIPSALTRDVNKATDSKAKARACKAKAKATPCKAKAKAEAEAEASVPWHKL